MQTVRFAPLFFEFWPKSAISVVSADTTDSCRYGPSWPDLARIGQSQSRVSASLLKKKKSTWHYVVGRVGNGVPRASPRPTTSDRGVAPLVLRLCFTRHFPHLIIFNL